MDKIRGGAAEEGDVRQAGELNLVEGACRR